MHVGDNIRRLRKVRRLSQGAVASIGGFDRPYISRIETGKQAPSLKFLRRLGNILDVPVADFFIYPVTGVSDGWLAEHSRERTYIDLEVLGFATLGAQRDRSVPRRTREYDGLVARVKLQGHTVEVSASSPDVFAVAVPGGAASPDVCPGDVLVIDPTAKIAHGDLALLEVRSGAPAEVRLVHFTGESPVYISYDRVSSPVSEPVHLWGRVIDKLRHYPPHGAQSPEAISDEAEAYAR